MSRDNKNPGILNLNAPLLSTRRPLFGFRERLSTSSRPISPPLPHHPQRIPFSWEHAPGKPKLVDAASAESDNYSSLGGHFTPLPRPPPSHSNSPCNFTFQHHLRQMSLYDSDVCKDEDGDGNGGYYCCYDNPTNGPDSLSTSNVSAADVFSLSEAIDALEKAEGPAARESDSNLTALKRMAESTEDTSPSFMINRFLPDANALAVSSALRYYSGNWNNKMTKHRRDSSYYSGHTGRGDEVEEDVEGRSSGRSYRKACGMERMFKFHWRMKPRFCGDSRSPVVRPPSILGNRLKPS